MDWFATQSCVVQALLGTLFTYGVTAAGAALVFFFREVRRKPLDIMMGFAAGVMIAASFWSLLAPAIELSGSLGHNAWLTAAVGFVSGGVFVMLADIFLSRVSLRGGRGCKRSLMLVSAITLHNIPEGLAVGVAFGCAAMGAEGASLLSAVMLALGIGLQNFPEGVCAAVPMRNAGKSCAQSFLIGQSSGMVEPIAGVLGALAATKMQALLPFALTFSAGAMIAVVCSELVPESFRDNKTLATIGVLMGFALMMVLDVALG
ncbi:MAG: ZIP family metal transporter [Clostridia bacterium]|nr:ZIP family metal transporter [Clostridia bacterium]